MFISWIVTSKLQPDAYLSIVENQYLRVAPNPGFLKFLGITSAERAFQPWSVSPLIEVWQEIGRRIRKTGARATGRSSVLHFQAHNDSVEIPVSFVLRFYRPNLLAIEVKIRRAFNVSLLELFNIRQISSHPVLSIAITSLVGIVNSGSIRDYSPAQQSYSFKPLFLIPTDLDQEQFEIWVDKNKYLLSGIVINNRNYDIADPTFADRIFEQSREVNVKFLRGAFSLVDKQGILTANSRGDLRFMKEIEQEHRRRCRFLELALTSMEFLTDYLAHRQNNEDVADFLLYLGWPLFQQDAKFPRTVTGTHVWNILSRGLGIPTIVEQMDRHFLQAIEAKNESFHRFSQEDYNSLDFSQKLHAEMRRYHKNWIENLYQRKPALVWIVGTLVAIGLGILKLIHG